jgi:nucleotide-binding universal stress UspA family protein
MSKIIVGADASERAEDAIAFAAQLARVSGATVVLAAAYPYDEVEGDDPDAAYGAFVREGAEGDLERLRPQVAGVDNVEVRAVPDTSSARALQDLAEREDAALIVLGSSRRAGLGRVLPGGTALRLLHGSPCPVAVVPNGLRSRADAPIQVVGCAYVGSEDGRAALAAAVAFARAAGAPLRVIHVIDTTVYGAPALTMGPGFPAMRERLDRMARETLEKAVAALPSELRAEPVLLAGDPAAELVAQSESLDVLVAGSRGYGPVRSVLLGGVSHRLVHEAACPVIVLPRGTSAQFERLFTTERAGGSG